MSSVTKHANDSSENNLILLTDYGSNNNSNYNDEDDPHLWERKERINFERNCAVVLVGGEALQFDINQAGIM